MKIYKIISDGLKAALGCVPFLAVFHEAGFHTSILLLSEK